MSPEKPVPKRYIGLDVHEHYLIAIGVDAELNQVYGPQRVQLHHLQSWMDKTLNQEDSVVLEMTTNTWQVYDDLLPHVHSVTVVHPPHVALITRSQVMTDKIASLILARLLAKGLLVGIWVPFPAIREQRSLVAQRRKMTPSGNSGQESPACRFASPPYSCLLPGKPFSANNRSWWLSLSLQRVRNGFDENRSGYVGLCPVPDCQLGTGDAFPGCTRRARSAIDPTPRFQPNKRLDGTFSH